MYLHLICARNFARICEKRFLFFLHEILKIVKKWTIVICSIPQKLKIVQQPKKNEYSKSFKAESKFS